MSIKMSRIVGLVAVLLAAITLSACGGLLPKSSTQRSYQPLKDSVVQRLVAMGSSPGAGMVMRIFKQSSELEVWKATKSGGYKLFNTYKICAWSGDIGPKVVEGDRQSPEGFYNITPGLMNPNSNYYLAFNTGFPNKFDRSWGRTGSELMVHGDCSSRGCYAMTDAEIAEIYALARESFNGGNAVVQLQIYPFRMTPKNLALVADNKNLSFWKNIKEGYDRFELSKTPPTWDVCEKKYVFGVNGATNTSLDAAGACPARSGDTLVAAIDAKEAADDAAFTTELAAIKTREAAAAAAKQAEADAAAAAKLRGQAIGGFVNGLFGGSHEQPAPIGIIDPTKSAPVPAPRIVRG
jgi:murein L,D-transpeptidase YafK